MNNNTILHRTPDDQLLVDACRDGDLGLVKNLVKMGIDTRENNKYISSAVAKKHMEIVKFLVENGANVEWGMETASVFGHCEIMEYLLKNVDNSTCNFSVVIDHAAAFGFIDIVKLLIIHIHEYNIRLRYSCALEQAAKNGHTNIVCYLIEAHGFYNRQPIKQRALAQASKNGHIETVKFLIDRGAKTNLKKYEPIRNAVQNDHLEIVKLLVEKWPKKTVLLKYIIPWVKNREENSCTEFLLSFEN